LSNILYQIGAYINVITLIAGTVLSLLLIFFKRKNRKADLFLGVILAIIILWKSWVLVTTYNLFWYYDFLDWIPFSSLFAIGPCIYMYTKGVVSNSIKYKHSDFTHFIPLIIEWIIFFSFNEHEGFENYQTYILFSFRFALQFLAVISIIAYAYFSLKMIKANLSFSDLSLNSNLKHVSRFILIFALLWFLWIPYALVNHFIFNFYISDYDVHLLYALIWVFTLSMIIKLVLRPEIILVEKSRSKSRTKKVPAKKILEDADWLNKKMESEKYYLNPDLTLQLLATELNLSANKISQTINEGLNKSFSDFVNEYRVISVIQKLNNQECSNLTILGIAYDSGFNSKTTFNRAFKKATGVSPAAYKLRLNKK